MRNILKLPITAPLLTAGEAPTYQVRAGRHDSSRHCWRFRAAHWIAKSLRRSENINMSN
jgi:hypothetical protein